MVGIGGLGHTLGDISPAELIARRSAAETKLKTKLEQRAELVLKAHSQGGKVRFSMADIRKISKCSQNNESYRVARFITEHYPGWLIWKTSDRIRTSKLYLSKVRSGTN
jgi:hypothetical protein